MCILEPHEEFGHVVLILEAGKAEELGLQRTTGDRFRIFDVSDRSHGMVLRELVPLQLLALSRRFRRPPRFYHGAT